MRGGIAFVHKVPDSFEDCLTTHIAKERPNLERARRQWKTYCERLEQLGYELKVLEENAHLADALFVEDTGVVLGGHFLQARMSAPSRREEVALVSKEFSETHRIVELKPPATLDGGDVLRVGRKLFVGQSGRTNREAYEQVRSLVGPLGYDVMAIEVTGCLHLKTAVTALDEETLLLNPRWVNPARFCGWKIVTTPDEEPFSANVLRAGGQLTVAAGYPRRAEKLE